MHSEDTTTQEKSDPSPDESGTDRAITKEGLALIWRFLKREPLVYFLACGGGMAWGVMVVVSTRVLGWVTDEAVVPAFESSKSTDVAWAAGLALLAVGVLRGLSVVARRWYGAVGVARIEAHLRHRFVDRMLLMPYKEYRNRPLGELLALSDSDATFSSMAMLPVPLVTGLFGLLGMSIVSLWLADWSFVVVAVILFPALMLTSRFFATKMVEPAEATQKSVAEVSAIANESFDGALVVKTLGIQPTESQRFSEASDELRGDRLRLAKWSAIYHPLVDALPFLGMVALIAVGAWRVGAGAVTRGDVVAAVTLFGWLNFPVRVLGFLFESLPRSLVSVNRIDSFTNRDVEEYELGDGPNLPDGPLGVEFKDVSFSYGEQDVLSKVSFNVAPGEVVALVGHTGSGKSTVGQLLARLFEPSSGEIRVGGARDR